MAWADSPKDIESIEVLGSRMGRFENESFETDLIIDRDAIKKAGYRQVSDLLRDLSLTSFGADRELSVESGTGTGSLSSSLNGLSGDKILVLLNGQRLMDTFGEGLTDISLFPVDFIQRVEILKGTASSLYGPDAIAGVINIVTRTAGDGFEFNFSEHLPEQPGGRTEKISASWGTLKNNYSLFTGVQWRKSQGIRSQDRSFSKTKPKDFSPTGSPGSWRPVGESQWNADPSCPDDLILPPDNPAGGGRCSFDYSQYSVLTADVEQVSPFVSFDVNLSDRLQWFTRGLFNHRTSHSTLAPAWGGFRQASTPGETNYTIPASVAADWGLDTEGSNIEVAYRLTEEAGVRKREIKTQQFSLQTGLVLSSLSSWENQIVFTYNEAEVTNTGTSGYALKNRLYDLATDDPSLFNPFAPSSNKSDISTTLYTPEQRFTSTLGSASYLTTAEILENWQGPVYFALEVSSHWQNFEARSDILSRIEDPWGELSTNNSQGHRNFQSLSNEWQLQLLEKLYSQITLRYDYFSDFGSTFNPSLGFSYKISPSWSLSSSISRGYKAPSLQSLNQNQQQGLQFGVDYTQCENSGDPENPACSRIQIPVISGGNSDLDETTSKAFRFEVTYNNQRDTSVKLDFFNIKLEDIVYAPSMRDVLRAENERGANYLSEYGMEVRRDSAGNIQSVFAPNVNLSQKEVSGLNFSFRTHWNLSQSYELGFQTLHSHLLKLNTQVFPGFISEDRLGWSGSPQWRNLSQLYLAKNVHRIEWQTVTIAGQRKNPFIPGCCGRIPTYTRHDLFYSHYDLLKSTLRLGVRNILGTLPPTDDTFHGQAGYLNTNLYDPRGRTFFVDLLVPF